MFFIAQSTVKVISGRLERGERYAEWRERVGEAGRGDGERGRGGKKTKDAQTDTDCFVLGLTQRSI